MFVHVQIASVLWRKASSDTSEAGLVLYMSTWLVVMYCLAEVWKACLAWQFERTLIVAEDDAEVSYLEGCTAPSYDKNQVCSFRHCSADGLLEGLALAGLENASQPKRQCLVSKCSRVCLSIVRSSMLKNKYLPLIMEQCFLCASIVSSSFTKLA